MPANPMTSSHSKTPPTGVELMECSAPVRSACWREWPKAIWTAIQPMITYMTPRAASPARASNRVAPLFAARRPAYRALRLPLPRAVRVTKMCSSSSASPYAKGQGPTSPGRRSYADRR
jgi:hypothetical protein